MILKNHFIKNYGEKAIRLKKLKLGLMNDNYFCQTHTGEYLLKVYLNKIKEEVAFEVEILERLKQANFISPRLKSSLNGDLISLFQGKPVIVYDYIKGKPLENFDIHLIDAGKYLGKLHQLLQKFKPSFIRKSWDPPYFNKLVLSRRREFLKRSIPNGEFILAFLKKELKKYSFPKLPSGVTHQDLKPENIIVNEGKIAGFIDFDNSYIGAFLHDITTTIIWTCFKGSVLKKDLLRSFIRGYESIRPLTVVERKFFDQALRWRILREIFIGPLVTIKYSAEVPRRLNYFMRIYHKLAN